MAIVSVATTGTTGDTAISAMAKPAGPIARGTRTGVATPAAAGSSMPPIPNVLSIAGVDPSGGAGVFADLKTFSALGAYGCGVVTALTAQNTRSVDGVSVVAADFIAAQLDTLLADVRIDAIKIGMLGAIPAIEVVASRLAGLSDLIPIVLDPVMIAKSGDALITEDAVNALAERLVPLATIITPNLPEAGVLLGQAAPDSLSGMRRTVEALRALMRPDNAWVLLKGGHLSHDDAVDLLFDGDRLIELRAPRVATANTHGTGCSLSSAIAALLPRAVDTPAAVQSAKDWLWRAIRDSHYLTIGAGHGPVHHFHALWPGLHG